MMMCLPPPCRIHPLRRAVACAVRPHAASVSTSTATSTATSAPDLTH